jgi:polypyrimidine tract-binding protein 2
LPPGISGTNDRCTVLVSNLNPDVSNSFSYS